MTRSDSGIFTRILRVAGYLALAYITVTWAMAHVRITFH